MYRYGDRRFGGRVLALAVTFGTSLALTTPSDGFEARSTATATSGSRSSPNIVLAQAMTPVTYSAEQSDSGEERFERECAECHGDDLRGGLLGGPPLRGVAFEQKFGNGAPASGLFLYVSTLMPPNQPGRYSPQAYAELMAYILDRNGYREGAPLPSDPDTLDTLSMEK